MIASLLAAILVAYLPGALLYRLPFAKRDKRAGLPADERVFWHVVVSLAWTLLCVLALAAAGHYRFERLLVINGAVSLGMLVVGGTRLPYGGTAHRAGWEVVLPVVLVVLGLWRFFPPSEYVIGGKDPGSYMNEGIQIAQRGQIVVRDAAVAAVPSFARDLFFPFRKSPDYYSNRFMGFFLQDAESATVVGQFPHFYPASIAVGYGLDGLTGARRAVGAWAVLGVLAVYFCGARLLGRGPAFAAAVLLSLHVIQVWFARYPNAEVVMQALMFASLLAFARAHQDGDRFFAPVAGALAGALVFVRIDALIGLVGMVTAGVLCLIVQREARLRVRFLIPVILVGGAAWAYFTGPMRAYFQYPRDYLANLPPAGVMVGVGGAATGLVLLIWIGRKHAERACAAVPVAVIAVALALAAYAWWLRVPIDRVLAEHDAYALRTFTDFYLFRPMLIAALAGLVIVAGRRFWRDPALVLTIVGFSVWFFYKIRIVPDHFWMTRRFLPVVLPGALLLGAAAAMGFWPVPRGWPRARAAVGAALLAVIGWQYAAAAAPVMPHVEYAGVIPYLERLANRFSERDLVIVESRAAASDVHVLALPLAYIYAKSVLVLDTPRPDKPTLHLFLADALEKYERVFFVGSGGTDLLSRRIRATPIQGERIQIPEYENARNAYPQGARRKEFDYSIYQLSLVEPGDLTPGPFALDVGDRDDIYVVRMHAKETSDGRNMRWTRNVSYVSIAGLTGGEREVILTMHDGGRPRVAPPARVKVYLNDVYVGETVVASGFTTYRFALPESVVRKAAGLDNPAQLKIESSVWNPRGLMGGPDDRDLGMMLDRVDVR